MAKKKQESLTAEQEKELYRRMTEHHDEEAFEEFVAANMGLVVYVVKKLPHWNLCGSMEREDLIQEGNIALIHAVRTWEPTHRFATYARNVIYGKVFRAIENQFHTIAIPVVVQERIRKLQKRRSELSQQLGREPTIKELVEATKWSEEDISELLSILQRQPISLDALNNDRLAEEAIEHD